MATGEGQSDPVDILQDEVNLVVISLDSRSYHFGVDRLEAGTDRKGLSGCLSSKPQSGDL